MSEDGTLEGGQLKPAIANEFIAVVETRPTEQLIDDINRVWHRSAVSTLVAVGELIVGACYAGDIARWRNRETNRCLKQLEQHERLPFARKTIYLALHFFDLSLRFSEQRFLQRLGVGHVRAVLGLASEQQELLLGGAQKHGWTIAELTRRAADVRRRSQRRSGRPPATPEKVLEREVHRHVVELERLLAGPFIEVCSPQRLVGIVNATHELKNQLAAWLETSP